MEQLESIEVDPEDVAGFQVGEQLFGRCIERIDRERCLVWVHAPSRAHRLRRWLQHRWWRLWW